MNFLQGRIIKAIGGFYYVLTDCGTYSCRAKGKFRKEKITPLVGDNAKIAVLDEEKKEGNLEEIFDRKSSFIRPPVANIDMLVITISAAQPAPDLFLADKLSVIAASAGVSVCFCINKAELDKNRADEIYNIYKNAGFSAVVTSTYDKYGIEELAAIISGKICAFAGNSGVGKSSLLNLVCNRSDLETGKVSEKIKRGKNTTRHSELIPMEGGGFVADTPGFSSFEVISIPASHLEALFPEIKRNLGACRFSGCAHINEPDCPVKEAYKRGEISESRYKNYIELYNHLKNIKEWMK